MSNYLNTLPNMHSKDPSKILRISALILVGFCFVFGMHFGIDFGMDLGMDFESKLTAPEIADHNFQEVEKARICKDLQELQRNLYKILEYEHSY